MGETHDGPASAAHRAQPESDPDSPGKSNFFTRLFRWDMSDDDLADDPRLMDRWGTAEMQVNLRNMRKLRVEDVCVPRADIVAVPEDASLAEVVEVFGTSEMSRLPVYADMLDQPRGLVHLKDLALKYGFGATNGAFDLRALLRPLLYVPPSMPIGVLLQKMQAARIHMALVIDEYGGVDGLVTIEDLLEQIVGEIGDEHDEDEGELWTHEAPDVYLAQARVDLEEFEAALGVSLATPELAEDVDTLGGLVFTLAGRVPARGELVEHPDGHEFEVVDADARRIKRLRLRLKLDADRDIAAGRAAQ